MTIQETTDMQDQEWLQARAGERFCIRIPAAKTNGVYSVTEFLVQPDDSTPVHLHKNEDEHVLVLEGTVRVLLGEKTMDATPGTLLSLPRRIVHAWGNATDKPIRMIITATPGGCEEALREIALAAEGVDLMAIATRYGVTMIGPPLLG